MLLTVLSVPGCPNVEVLIDRVRAVLGDHADDLAVIVVGDDERAGAWGMTGSPTLLVDGVDPFAVAGVEASVSCRLYRGSGCVGGAPSIEDLRGALGPAQQPTPPDWTRSGPELVGRARRGRRAPAEGGLRAVQQAMLRAVAGSGSPPGLDDLDRAARPFGRPGCDVLAELAAQDYLSLDAPDRARALYPFSAVPSRHRVRIQDGPTVWAMCAVDALGIAPMLDRPVIIETDDPITTEPIRIHCEPAAANGDPPHPVVYLGARCGDGPAERVCCDAINVFVNRHSATRWAALHPDVHGEIVGLAEAADLGRTTFGALLAE